MRNRPERVKAKQNGKGVVVKHSSRDLLTSNNQNDRIEGMLRLICEEKGIYVPE